MITIKVHFANGDSFITGINANLTEAAAYYVGQFFNLGTVKDCMVKCTRIELV